MKNKIKTFVTVLFALVGIVLLSGYEGPTGNIQWMCVIPGIICLVITMLLGSTLEYEPE